MAENPSKYTAENLRATLINFYAAHNPEKCSTVDVILERFTGDSQRLVIELEKKYNVSLSAYAPANINPLENKDKSLDNDVLKQEPYVAVVQSKPVNNLPSHSPSTLQASIGDQSLQKELSLARNELKELKSKLELKDSISASRLQENTTEHLRRLNLAQQRAMESETLLTNKLESLQLEIKSLKTSLESSHQETDRIRIESSNRLDQICAVLESHQQMESQLSMVLNLLGDKHNPYTIQPHQSPPRCVDNQKEDQTLPTQEISAEFTNNQIEVSVLFKAKFEAEKRCKEQEREIEQLYQTCDKLKHELMEKDQLCKQLTVSLDIQTKETLTFKNKTNSLTNELKIMKTENERLDNEVDRLEASVSLSTKTLREMQQYSEKQQQSLNESVRRRIDQMIETSLMQREECLSQDVEVLSSSMKVFTADKELMRLEVDDLTKAVLNLKNDRSGLELEVKHLKLELKRAAALVLKYSPPGFIQTFVTEGVEN